MLLKFQLKIGSLKFCSRQPRCNMISIRNRLGTGGLTCRMVAQLHRWHNCLRFRTAVDSLKCRQSQLFKNTSQKWRRIRITTDWRRAAFPRERICAQNRHRRSQIHTDRPLGTRPFHPAHTASPRYRPPRLCMDFALEK